MKIGLFLHPNIEYIKENVALVIKFLLENEQEVFLPTTIDSKIIKKSNSISYCNYDEMRETIDTLFSVGGDGTFLGAARLMVKTEKPVLGIHVGGLGFLADVSISNFKERLTDFFKGNYIIEPRMALNAKVEYENGFDEEYAFNDFVIDRGTILKMIKIKAYVDDDYLHTYIADGLIISTPTGSTAYSLSVGGPIVVPKLNVIVISPISSHSLSVRPVVVSADQKIFIDCSEFGENVLLVADGQKSISLGAAKRIKLYKSDYDLQLVRFRGDSFFHTLRVKMSWGKDIRSGKT